MLTALSSPCKPSAYARIHEAPMQPTGSGCSSPIHTAQQTTVVTTAVARASFTNRHRSNESAIDTVVLRLGDVSAEQGEEVRIPLWLDTPPADGTLPPFTISVYIASNALILTGVSTTSECVLSDSIIACDWLALGFRLGTNVAVEVREKAVLCFVTLRVVPGGGTARNVLESYGARFLEGQAAMLLKSGTVYTYPPRPDGFVDPLRLHTPPDSTVLHVVVRARGAVVEQVQPKELRVGVDGHDLPVLDVEGGEYGSPYRVLLSPTCHLGSDRMYRVEFARDSLLCHGEKRLDASHWPSIMRVDGPAWICGEGSVTLDVCDGYDSYQWSTGETTRSITVREAGVYSVAVRDSKGICPPYVGAVRVDEAPPARVWPSGVLTPCAGIGQKLATARRYATYRWSTGETAEQITVWSSGSFWADVVDSMGCQLRTDSVMVMFTDTLHPRLSPPSSNILCPGARIDLAVAEEYERYEWSTGDTTRSIRARAAGSYWARVWRVGGCSGCTDTVVLHASSAAQPVISAPVLEFCEGDSVRVAVDDPGQRCIWSDGSVGASIVVHRRGRVWARVLHADGCEVQSNSLDLIDWPRPPEPYIVRYADTLHTAPATAYQWYLNGVVIPGANTWRCVAHVTGEYQVEVWNDAGCSSHSTPFLVTTVPVVTPFSATVPHISLYPQPARDALRVRIEGGHDPRVGITIRDMLGREVFRRDVVAASTQRVIDIDTHALPRGSYRLVAYGDQWSETRMLLLW